MSSEEILFWLQAVEGNEAAQDIINPEANSFYRVELEGRGALKVGLNTAPKVPGRLISLGRDPAQNDFVLPGRIYSKNHCHFYFNKSSSLILRDTSSTRSTQVGFPGMDNESMYQLQGDPRQRVLLTKHRTTLQIGPVHFKIRWRRAVGSSTDGALELAKKMFAQKQIAPGLDLTFLDLQSLPTTAYELRSYHTPLVAPQYQKLPKIVHEKLDLLGSGAFGTVHSTMDLNTGNLWAIKTSICGVNDQEYKKDLKREVEILADLSHPNIVKFTHSQGWTFGFPVEIFMSLHEGSLMNLIPPHKCNSGVEQHPDFCPLLVKHVLHAIAYLHEKGIVHRDIKPENILYDHNGQDSSLTFYISDFVYMAPEVSQGKYTSKSDMWSFAVMMLLVLGYFCSKDPDLGLEEWKVRMSLLPRYRSDLPVEADLGPLTSLNKWKNQVRWYGRLQSMVQHRIVPQLLRPLLAWDEDKRPNARECLSAFFP